MLGLYLPPDEEVLFFLRFLGEQGQARGRRGQA